METKRKPEDDSDGANEARRPATIDQPRIPIMAVASTPARIAIRPFFPPTRINLLLKTAPLHPMISRSVVRPSVSCQAFMSYTGATLQRSRPGWGGYVNRIVRFLAMSILAGLLVSATTDNAAWAQATA